MSLYESFKTEESMCKKSESIELVKIRELILLRILKLIFYKIVQKIFFDFFKVYFAVQHTQIFLCFKFIY